VSFDRQAIERKDFPISRRGYDTIAVDAHLRALAAEYESLQRAAASGNADMSLASTAGSHVQSILEAAETAAAEIERQAQADAQRVREEAELDVERTREDAVAKARKHVASVARIAATLLERVGAMDGEVTALIESLRAGAGRLAGDLGAVEMSMGELYDAAAGNTASATVAEPEAAPPRQQAAQPQAQAPAFEAELAQAMGVSEVETAPEPQAMPQPQAAPSPPPPAEADEPAGDVDGARLIALNMALNGESRADTERYLAENFQLPDRLKLVDEVYAAIEG
jgi:DivIVA domain-containing protein